MTVRRSTELREAPMHLAEDWFQVGVTRGLLLGPLYPWLAGFVTGVLDSAEAALVTALTVGVFGTLIGLFVGPLLGGMVGVAASLLDRRLLLRTGPREVGALAILVVAGALTAIAVSATAATGSSLADIWSWLSLLVLGPAALGLCSLVVPPRVDRPGALRRPG